MGCRQLKHLQRGQNAIYTSRRITMEFLQLLGEKVEQDQLEELLASPVFSILIDETTDIAVINEMVIYVHFIDSNAQVHTVFMKIVELPNGCAETIEQALLAYLEKYIIM